MEVRVVKLWRISGLLVLLVAGGAAMGQTAPQGTPPEAPQGTPQAIPDSPRPQTLPNAAGVAPGQGATSTSRTGAEEDADAPTNALPASKPPVADAAPQQAEPELKPELGPGGRVQTLRTQVNFVQVPFTVKDNKGRLVPALEWRDVRVFENGIRQHISFFSVDPFPLSVAFVIDQSLDFHTMGRVNASLGAVQGAFTAYDEMAVFTYNNGPRLRTDYTKADGPRVAAVLQTSQTTGREAVLSGGGGPLDQTTLINGKQFDPNTAPVRNSASTFQTLPKEQHTLNDAIFAAAQTLAKRPDGRRRILYVVSDGKEYGSKVKQKDLIRYLQTNNISVYATIVGDSATKYIGFLERYHLPYEMKENILPQYVNATGGEAVSAVLSRGIEESFAKIADDVRTKYTVGYYSQEPLTDGKFRRWEVQVMRPGLNVIAPPGYYPTPRTLMRQGSAQPASTPVQ